MTPIDWDDIYANLSSTEPPEKLNPYKVCVLLMIREYVELITEKKFSNSNVQRITASTFLNVVRKTNSCFEKLMKIVKIHFPHEFHHLFCSNLISISNCFDQFLTFLNESKASIFERVDHENKTVIEKCSVVGHFVRRLWLTTEKSSYTELMLIWNRFKSYVSEFSLDFEEFFQMFQDLSVDESSVNISTTDNDDNDLDLNFNGSTKELKRIIQYQISNLQLNQAKHLAKTNLDKWIQEMRKKYPDCYDLLFLKYLTAERLGNFVGAETSLHEYFDWNAVALSKDKPEGGGQLSWSKSLRFGPLLLSQLNREFNHREAALSHLQESIVKAQESNDNECLQYALAEYCLLVGNQCEDASLQNLYNVSLKGSRDLNLQHIFEKTQLCQILSDFQQGRNVSKAIEILQAEAMDTSGEIKQILYPIVLSSIYLAHGMIEQSSLEAQKFLCSCPYDANLPDVERVSESQCIAMCNLAFCLSHTGNIVGAKEVIDKGKSIFSANRYFDHLSLCEACVGFSQSLYQCDFDACRKFVTLMSAVSKEEATLCNNLLNITVGNTDKTSLELKQLLRSSKTAYFRCRVLLLLTDYYIALEKNVGMSLSYAEECKKLSVSCEYRQFYAMIRRRFALISLLMNEPSSALDVLNSSEKLIEMFASRVELGKFYFTKAKCLMSTPSLEVEEQFPEIEQLLLKSVNVFQRCDCIYLEKELCYNLALFYNERNSTEDRNTWSKRFKELDFKINGHYPILIL